MVNTPAIGTPQTDGAAPPTDMFSMLHQMVAPLKPAAAPENPINKLVPGSEVHAKVLRMLDARVKFSRDKMREHYPRWNFNEQKIQAYTGLNDYQRLTENMAQRGSTPPQPITVVVPYSYATIHAAGTFISNVLLGRKPIFPLLATRGTEIDRARFMEAALQSNIDYSRGSETLWQGIWDSLVYGFGPQRVTWEERTGASIRWVAGQRQMTNEMTFAGNVLTAIDPYAFYPDPRVPIHQANVRGEFIFAEMQMSDTMLKDMEADGQLKWVKEGLAKAGQVARGNRSDLENRRRVKLGINGSADIIVPSSLVAFRPMHEGTCRIVPKDWGLGSATVSELWKFSWLEGAQVLQAEPLNMVHNQHPYTASEPTSFGHDFMSLSMADMIGNFQDILSWLVSSRMENVRAVVQNSFVADPARVDINDIRSSAIGRIIRLKQTAMGTPVKEAIMQIMQADVTSGNMGDMQNMRILADTITGVSDSTRGIMSGSSRRSATEARIAMQASSGRLAQMAIRISAQSYHPAVNQMVFNIQQFMPTQMWIETTGDDGTPSSQSFTPEMLVGSFNYQVSDGTLPFDKVAALEVWKEILMGVAQDPELRATKDITKIFDYVAELGGAKNIDRFNKPVPPPIQTAAAPNPGADPNMVPIGAAMPTAPLLASNFHG